MIACYCSLRLPNSGKPYKPVARAGDRCTIADARIMAAKSKD
jgi:hypothetical protein